MAPRASPYKRATRGCPCGFLGDERRPCRCTPERIARYRGRLSGPLRDRIDLIVDVPAVALDAISNGTLGESSAAMRSRVLAARRSQLERYGPGGPTANAGLRGRAVARHCAPDAAGRTLLRRAVERFGLSARGYDRVLKVARTIADLSGDASVSAAYVAEALQYRLVD